MPTRFKGTKTSISVAVPVRDETNTITGSEEISVYCGIQLFNINGADTPCVDVGGLAIMAGRSPITLRKWEKMGWLPPANLRAPTDSETQPGARLYTVKYAVQVGGIIREVLVGVAVTPDITRKLYVLFKQEAAEIHT